MRRINFTHRLKMTKADVRFKRLQSKGGPFSFQLEVDFAKLRKTHSALDIENALVSVEVYIGSRTERFNCGTVRSPLTGPFESTQFRDGDRIQIRVKVADVLTRPGRLLGFRQIRPGEDDAPHQSLLPIDVRPLDHVPFLVEFGGLGEHPVLVLNNQLEDPNEPTLKFFAQSDVFVALVLPSAVREILNYYLFVEPATGSEESDDPRSQWYELSQRYNSQPLSEVLREDSDVRERQSWIDVAVQGFARDWKAVDKLRNFVKGNS